MPCCGGKDSVDTEAETKPKAEEVEVEVKDGEAKRKQTLGPPPTVVTKNKSNRGCTDIIFTLLFIGAWAGVWYIFGYSVKHGADYRK
jgi:hypothetical protein